MVSADSSYADALVKLTIICFDSLTQYAPMYIIACLLTQKDIWIYKDVLS